MSAQQPPVPQRPQHSLSAEIVRPALPVPSAPAIPLPPRAPSKPAPRHGQDPLVTPLPSAPPVIVPMTSIAVPQELVASPIQPLREKQHDWQGMTQMDIAVALMSNAGPKAHQVWLPPLEAADTLDMLMPDLAVDPLLGLTSRQWRGKGQMVAPIGVMDVPLEQRRDPLSVDLSGSGGNLVVVGGPLTGKSTLLRTLVMSVSLTMTPQEAQIYIADFGGGTFVPFAGAVHVAGVVTRDDPATLGRMIAEVEDIMERREAYFKASGIDSMTAYRLRRARGEADDGHGDVFLVVDGWGTVRSDFELIEARINVIATRGLGFGVHVLVSAARWAELRQSTRDVIGTRLELRLGDPSDSSINRQIAPQVPENHPGRGLEPGGHHMLTALPRIDHQQDAASLGDGVTDALSQIGQAWGGKPGPKLQLLPTRVTLEELRGRAPAGASLILGLEERRLGVFTFDPAQEHHLLAFGDAKSGKTNLIRLLTREIRRVAPPDQAALFVIDTRRTLLGEVPDDYLASYIATRDDALEMIDDLAVYLKTRLPGKDVTTDQLRNHSWWTGPDVWVVVDDYDLVVTQAGNPLQPLQQFLAQAGDVGLHLVIARRSAGAARQAFDPILQMLIELGSTGILLSGSPDEGQILPGVKFRRSQPGRVQVVSREHDPMVGQLALTEPVA